MASLKNFTPTTEPAIQHIKSITVKRHGENRIETTFNDDVNVLAALADEAEVNAKVEAYRFDCVHLCLN